RRRAANNTVSRPNSTRAAGAGGSSNTMLKLYTDDSPGLKVDPFIVLVLSLAFIASIVFLHILQKL
ncbi:Sec61beta family-domain-containing protein, partial [Mucidula mucida]